MLKRGGSRPPRHDLVLYVHNWGAAEILSSTGDKRKTHSCSLHINSMSAGATPFNTHSKLSSCETGLSTAKMFHKDRTCLARQPMCQKLWNPFHIVPLWKIYFCAADLNGHVLEGWTHSSATCGAMRATPSCLSGGGRERVLYIHHFSF